MKRRWTLIAGLALAVALGAGAVVLVSSVGGAEKPTRAAYIAQVEAICDEYGEKLDRIPPPGDLSSPGAVVGSLQAAIPVLTEEADEVRELARPPALRVKLDRFFLLTDRSIVELQRALDAALGHELYPMAVALTDFGKVRDQAKQVAGQIGFECSA